jgi:glycogen synthase
MRQAMTRDFSWEAAAREYVALYRELQPAPPR